MLVGNDDPIAYFHHQMYNKTKCYSPHHDMRIPSCLSVMTTPSYTFTIKCKIFGYPQNWQRQPTELCFSVLTVKTTSYKRESIVSMDLFCDVNQVCKFLFLLSPNTMVHFNSFEPLIQSYLD